MDIELRHARIVITISNAGSISKGAAELNVPQPSLTAQLHRIERAFGGELFQRSRSGVQPTELGERLIPLLGDLVRSADAVAAEADAATSSALLLGNTEWTPPGLRDALQNVLPERRVRTETRPPEGAVEAVREGALHAALVPGAAGTSWPTEHPGLEHALIVREPVWLALPRAHPLAGRSSLGAAELARLRWVRYSGDHWFHPVEARVFADSGLPVPPEAVHRVGGHREAMDWVRDNGVAALTTPSGGVSDVALLPLPGAERVRMLFLWRGGALPERNLRRLVEAVRRYYCAYARTVPGYGDWLLRHPQDAPGLGPWLGGTVRAVPRAA